LGWYNGEGQKGELDEGFIVKYTGSLAMMYDRKCNKRSMGREYQTAR